MFNYIANFTNSWVNYYKSVLCMLTVCYSFFFFSYFTILWKKLQTFLYNVLPLIQLVYIRNIINHKIVQYDVLIVIKYEANQLDGCSWFDENLIFCFNFFFFYCYVICIQECRQLFVTKKPFHHKILILYVSHPFTECCRGRHECESVPCGATYFHHKITTLLFSIHPHVQIKVFNSMTATLHLI